MCRLILLQRVQAGYTGSFTLAALQTNSPATKRPPNTVGDLNMIRRSLRCALLLCAGMLGQTLAADRQIDTFERQQLTDVYYSEGVNIGDVNKDGVVDVVHGPYWFQ